MQALFTAPPLSTFLWTQELEDHCNSPSSPLLLKCTPNEAPSLLLSLPACLLTAARSHVWFICLQFLQSKELMRQFCENVQLNSLLVTSCQNPELLSSFATRELLQFPLEVTVFLSLCTQVFHEQSWVATFRVLYLIYPHRHFLYKEPLFLSFSNQLSQDGQTVTVGPVGSRWWLGWNLWWRGSRSETKTSWRWIKKSCNKSVV